MAREEKVLPVESVVFRKDLYPRMEGSPETVQAYAATIDVLPPIEINQHNELIDGWHRWTAHKKVGRTEIAVVVTETSSDMELLELAIERNATWGLQLSLKDKQSMARKIYAFLPASANKDERAAKKKHLQQILAVDERTIRDWLSRIDKDREAERNEKIFDLWLACWTGEAIGEAVGVVKSAVLEVVCSHTANLPPANKLASEHGDEKFKVPIYNVWKQQEKSGELSHFGNTEAAFVDNLLYLYTKPVNCEKPSESDIVIDPFAGSGSTINVCKKRLRRYFVSDRLPIVERQEEIRQHDIVDGPLKPPQWGEVALVYLDPPYWKQAAGEYSSDPTDLSNMDLETFNKTLSGLINDYASKLKSGAHIALIIQPTQWKNEDKSVTDHVFQLAGLVSKKKLDLVMRISCPYESQQNNAQMVEWAKANRSLLVLTREIIVWKVIG